MRDDTIIASVYAYITRIKKYYGQVYNTKFNKLNEMNKLLERHKLVDLT